MTFYRPVMFRCGVAHNFVLKILGDILHHGAIRLFSSGMRAIAKFNHPNANVFRAKFLADPRAGQIDVEVATFDLLAGVGNYILTGIASGTPDLNAAAYRQDSRVRSNDMPVHILS